MQGLVKRFEVLDVRDRDVESAERRKKHEAELRRAQIAREEAESDVRRLREEVRRLKEDNAEGRDRERKVGKRLEVVMVSRQGRSLCMVTDMYTQDEYAQMQETRSSQTSVYDKELRKARKEAFKSSSHLLKLQEELKSARQSLRITQSGFELEKQKVQRREQETFEAQYQLVAVQEDLSKLNQRLNAVEAEKEALKTSLKKDEVTRIAAEGMIALLAAGQDDDDLCSSPRKHSPKKQRPRSPLSDDKENMHFTPKKNIDHRRLQDELDRERMRREHAEEMLEFLSMECAFRCCNCRIATKMEHECALSIPGELVESLDVVRNGMQGVLRLPGELDDAESMQVDVEPGAETGSSIEHQVFEVETASTTSSHAEVPIVQEDDRSMTLQADEAIEDSPEVPQQTGEDEEPMAPHPTPVNASVATEESAVLPSCEDEETTADLIPSTPNQTDLTTPFRHQGSMRTVTTTTTVPMHFTPVSKPLALLSEIAENSENVPPASTTVAVDEIQATPTFDRAAALAAIQYRRGRAKSFAQGQLTPRKQMVDLKERRDISAPALGQKAGGMMGGSVAKSTGSVGRAGGRRMV